MTGFSARMQAFEDDLKHLLLIEPAPTELSLRHLIDRHDADFDELHVRATSMAERVERSQSSIERALLKAGIETLTENLNDLRRLFDQVKARIEGSSTEGHA